MREFWLQPNSHMYFFVGNIKGERNKEISIGCRNICLVRCKDMCYTRSNSL